MTRASVELYDMGERNGGRPAGEGAKTPWPTLEKIKRVKSAHVWLLNGRPVLMRQRTMLDLVDKRGVSSGRLDEGVWLSAHPELCSTYPHYYYYLHTYNNNNSNNYDHD